MPDDILLNDLLRLPLEATVKAKFNMWNGEVDPIDDYVEDPDAANTRWLAWRGARGFFRVGQTALCLMKLPTGDYLLTGVRRIVSDTGVPKSDAYGSEDIPELQRYCGRVVVSDPGLSKMYCVRYPTVAGELRVMKILPERYGGEAFPGSAWVQGVTLRKLEAFARNGRTDWIGPLSSQKGVYLITDTKTMRRYVGSAYGAVGIWQRWQCYVATGGHGGNVELMRLLRKNREYGRANFEFSILETLGSHAADVDVLEREGWWKRTLHTELELNRN